MPLVDNVHYVDSVGHAAVTAWATGAAKTVGNFIRATAPASNSERIFICVVAGTTHATTQPTWVTTRGGLTTDNTVTWQECSGLSGVNGDLVNTPSWADLKAITSTGVLGQLIKNNAATHYFLMTIAGTIGASQPTFNTTAGNTTVDNGATWTCIGAVGNFTGNQAPQAKIFNAITTNWGAAGNTIFVKSSHAHSQSGAIGLTGAGTVASPQRWLCHDGGAYPPLAANLTTGASETCTTAGTTISSLGLYCEGLTFINSAASGNFSVTASNCKMRFKNCTFTRSSTNGSITFGSTASTNASQIDLENPTLNFNTSSNTLAFQGGTVNWYGGTIGGSALPTTMMTAGSNPSANNANLFGVDLSAFGSGKTLVGAMTSFQGLLRFVNCKLGASVTPGVTPSNPSYRLEFKNCDSGAISYNSYIYDYTGTMTIETTVVLSGGASDGTTPISWKIDTTANAKFDFPFICPPIAVYSATAGAKTLTIQGIWGGGAVPNDEDIWVEVEYPGNASFPITSFISDAKATVLTTTAGQAAGAGTWGGSTTKFALSVTFTTAMKGQITARVKCAKASSTFYIDPKPVFT